MDAQRFDTLTKSRNLGILLEDPWEFRNSGTFNIREITYGIMQPGGFSLWSCSIWSGELSFLYDKQFAVKLISLRGTVNNSNNNKIQLRKITYAKLQWHDLHWASISLLGQLYSGDILLPTSRYTHFGSDQNNSLNLLIGIYRLHWWNNSIQLLF